MQVREFDLRSLDKMLPCPFCGGEAELDTAQSYRAINGHFGNRVVVYCTKCGADMGTCVEDVPDIHPNEVIERWNCRAGVAARLRSMEEALRPFAEELGRFGIGNSSAHVELRLSGRKAIPNLDLSVADFERARAALSGEQQ